MKDIDENTKSVIHVSTHGCRDVNCKDCPLFITLKGSKERILCLALQEFDDLPY